MRHTMYDILEQFQKYIYHPHNYSKYCPLSPNEQVLLYYFEHLDNIDQYTLLKYMYTKLNN